MARTTAYAVSRSPTRSYAHASVSGRTFSQVITHAALAATALVVLMPLLIMFLSAFKHEADILGYPVRLIPKTFTLENFIRVKDTFPRYIVNSVKVTTLITVIQLVTSTTAAYAFAKLRWRGRDALFLLYVSSIMVPVQTTIIPQFIIIRHLGLYDTHLSLILSGAFTAFGTFLVRQYFLTIPDSLLEAARIDGANELTVFLRIMLPLAKPAIAAQAIFAFRYFWNDFFTPLIFLSSEELKTIPLGMADFATEYYTYYGPQIAAASVAVVPVMILFVAAQRYFVQGIAASALKG